MSPNKKLIWVLEDSESSRFVFEEILSPIYRLELHPSLEALSSASRKSKELPSLLVADIRLGDGNFLEFLGSEAAQGVVRFPFMITSSLDQADILRTAYQEGALDYLIKPFTHDELIVKIERVLGESQKVSLDISRFRLRQGDRELPSLTPKELQIFTLLQNARGTPVSRQELQQEIWGSTAVSSKSLDVHLFHMRKKLAPAGMVIEFIPNEGFTLRETAPART